MDIKSVEFDGKIRLREVGGYLNIPKDVMKELNAKTGDKAFVKFLNCPTNSGTWSIGTTIQKPPSIYLRKLDLEMIGLVSGKGKDERISALNIKVSMHLES